MGRVVSETVQHAAYQSGSEDAHGNQVDGWATAVQVGVYAFDPGGSSEPLIPGHDRVITTPTIYAPTSVVFGDRDRVTARGVLYEVEGETRAWVHPDGSQRGNVIGLRRVVG